MNKKIKKNLKILFTTVILILNSCQKEDLEESSLLNQNGSSVKEFSFKEAFLNPEFKNAYKKVTDPIYKISSKNREADTNFTIDSTSVKQVTSSGITTFTMAIRRKNNSTSFFENLIIQVKQADSTKAFISKFTPNQSPAFNQNHNASSFNGTIQVKEIQYNATTFSAKIFPNCITILLCDFEGTHLAGEKCAKTYEWVYCYGSDELGGTGSGAISTGSPGSGGTAGSQTGTSGNPNEQTNPLVSAPVVPKKELMQKPENCQTKKKLENDATFKYAMSNLLSYARNGSFETYNVMNNATNPTPTNNFTYNIQNGTLAAPELAYVGNINMQGVIHSHFGDLFSIFSGQDLYDLYIKLKNNPQITDNIFLGLVTSKNTAYLLQIEDRNTFIAFGDAYMPTERELARFMKDKMADKYGMYGNGNSATNELGFYKMMSDLNMGVNLSSAPISSTAPPSASLFDSWTTKFYDKKSGQIKILNCL